MTIICTFVNSILGYTTTTSTAGPTTTTTSPAPPSTTTSTVLPTTTTTVAYVSTTTTTCICPTTCSGCRSVYYIKWQTTFIECGGADCGGELVMLLNAEVEPITDCYWSSTTGPDDCEIELLCEDGEWKVRLEDGGCTWTKCAEGTYDCPDGVYLRDNLYCSGCPLNLQVFTYEQITTTTSTPHGPTTTTTTGITITTTTTTETPISYECPASCGSCETQYRMIIPQIGTPPNFCSPILVTWDQIGSTCVWVPAHDPFGGTLTNLYCVGDPDGQWVFGLTCSLVGSAIYAKTASTCPDGVYSRISGSSSLPSSLTVSIPPP